MKTHEDKRDVMTDWRKRILQRLATPNCETTVVYDQDGLLLDEKILAGIRMENLDLVNYDDDVNFRYVFESRYRSKWDSGLKTDKIPLIRTSQTDPASLPYDIVSSSRSLSFDLGSMFPDLSSQVVAAIPKDLLDKLFDACATYKPDKLSVTGSIDFILRHVYLVAPELVKQPEDMLRFLLSRHLANYDIPDILVRRLIEQFGKNPNFRDWPLETILDCRNAFFEFLQERWPIFVKGVSSSRMTGRDAEDTGPVLKYGGPADLPFDSHDVRVYMDNLFLEGLLKPIDLEEPDTPLPEWVARGVNNSEGSQVLHKLGLLLEHVESSMPDSEAGCAQWLGFAYRWAELSLLINPENVSIPKALAERISSARSRLDETFYAWINKRYSGLASVAPFPPVMVSHIPRFLARALKEKPETRILFILVDGMAVDQWIAARRTLQDKTAELRYDEKSVFAWAPTLTSFSRQSAFAGKAPMFFPSSVYSTEREQSHWTAIWTEMGLKRSEIGFEKAVQPIDEAKASTMFEDSAVRVAGLVLTQVDSIMHGTCLGLAGMQDQVRLWASQGNLLSIIRKALDSGFDVYISSDHGNVESTGIGRPSEGVEAEVRGQRVRIFDNAQARFRVKSRFPDSIEWDPVGLPENCFPLFASGRTAFASVGERIVTHGGLSLEELVVPFVRVGRS